MTRVIAQFLLSDEIAMKHSGPCRSGVKATKATACRVGSARTLRLTVAFLSIFGSALSEGAEPPSPTAAGVEFFEKQIRPLLAEHCYSCHSEKAKRVKGGLYLDTEKGWLKGGDLGASVVPGDLENSLLFTAVRYSDETLQMPPKGKLPADNVELLGKWVKMGAPAPQGGEARPVAATGSNAPARSRDFWAFQTPADPALPKVNDSKWVQTGVDPFILAGLEAKNLTPAKPADKRTLIRRATFDLTGLPPTPEEVDAFLKDETPEAFARVVDRLLASPQYGERWGRHWLDVARYADSNGLDENICHGNAWRYRDYVVSAFNQDKPYDQFVMEQIAGDLLPPTDSTALKHERLVATGYLVLGPKVLAEPDETKMEMDIVDEQVDTMGRTFMGLTLGCARCHDHKFDPISTADYYGLAGIFKSTRTMESFKKIGKWNEIPIPTEADLSRQKAYDQDLADRKKAIDALTTKANETLVAEKGKGFALPKAPDPLYPEATRNELKRLRDELAALTKTPPEMPMAMGVGDGKVEDTKVHIRGSHLTLGKVVPRRVPEVLVHASAPSFSETKSGRLELARWLVGDENPLTSRVMVNRIWRWHFGEGLVGTPDNFGALGGRPTNQPLLDWLAHRFIDANWSVKSMHRLIMLSSAYQMSGAADPRALQADPENRLVWRMNLQRLEAEEVRDSLLAIGGSLDRTMGGSLITVKNRAFFFDHTSKDMTKYDAPRRSIYLPVVRNHLYEVFQLFDSTDATVTNGDRASTTVAPQALFMMNGDLVLEVAHALAVRLTGRADLDDSGRVKLLYENLYGRPPGATELKRAAAYFDRFARALETESGAKPDSSHVEAWEALCQALLSSNEFLYVR